MITIHNFYEALQQYKSGLIPFRLLQEQAAVTLSLTSYPAVANAFEITDEHIHWLMKQPESNNDYSILLGGNFCICECEADLKQIVGCNLIGQSHTGVGLTSPIWLCHGMLAIICLKA